ncbi:MAG: hypothetical protein DME42_11410 [Verrucomicrobia bacterium]|nr:MAG: hypothetical protein DME42_11410 [Verrucomicrobiota bacterium]
MRNYGATSEHEQEMKSDDSALGIGMPGEGKNLIKLDLHIHTLDDPKDKLDYSAHELLARARRLGFSALAITLHDEVFDRPKVFADAQRLGILLIPAAEMRIQGADIILLNVMPQDVEGLRDFDDIRELRKRRGETLFTIAPHPFYAFLIRTVAQHRWQKNMANH